MLIHKERRDIFKGNIEIHLSRDKEHFTVKFPEGVRAPERASQLTSFREAMEYVKAAELLHVMEECFTRKVILLALYSSSKEPPPGASVGNGSTRHRGTYVGLNWAVADEYTVPHQREIVHNTWKGGQVRERNYFNYTKMRYNITEVHGRHFASDRVIMQNEVWRVFTDNEGQILPYSDEAVAFLQETEQLMEAMVEKVTAFFAAPSPEELMARMKPGAGRLLTAPDTGIGTISPSDGTVWRRHPDAKPPMPEKCTQPGCENAPVADYNGQGCWVCPDHLKILNNDFNEEHR